LKKLSKEFKIDSITLSYKSMKNKAWIMKQMLPLSDSLGFAYLVIINLKIIQVKFPKISPLKS